MPRTADPRRRLEVVDGVIEQLARTGISDFSLRTLAQGLGHSTRVLTHHFADKKALLEAVLQRLDQRQHEELRSTPGWDDPSVPVGSIVRAAWKRNLGPDELAMTRLIREIEGLAAAGRLPLHVPGFVRGRADFVASCLVTRGLSRDDAITKATVLNAAFGSLEGDYLITGDEERVERALDALCSWIDACVAAGQS
ncbi:TetR/AcrR family transcriptional regulator [Nocardiopsis gilva YIM 90087]|uniref:TetR/AcrR family transcriptional regulator n=1 Tax=Nocardiopsis gilva YIM 90087 TaxID=1235441 RepID=A0A223SDN6_9ACTN|nr:TetR/AcrR family transcriptional regulator [Nocardiopsis gilva]ASU86235.1 TetR/AcrR family transcriptional regulator [Nocardiopsis gilva YIM 90087]